MKFNSKLNTSIVVSVACFLEKSFLAVHKIRKALGDRALRIFVRTRRWIDICMPQKCFYGKEERVENVQIQRQVRRRENAV